MLHLKNFKEYRPEEFPFGKNTIYFISEEGLDFYSLLSEFKEETIKVLYDKKGLVINCSKDASEFYPLNCSIMEIKAEVPKDISYDGRWVFNPSKEEFILSDDFIKRELDKKKTQNLNQINEKLLEIQDIIDLEGDSQELSQSLSFWKSKRVATRQATKESELPSLSEK